MRCVPKQPAHTTLVHCQVDDVCSASITLAARVASFENATGLPQKDRTRAFRFGLGSGARDPGRSRWSPPGQPAGGVAPASWGDVVGSAKRRRRAARRRQSRTRRCKVRSWPGRNTPGCSRQRRSKSSFAVRCGSVSSHWTIRGQLVSNGSCRVRQCRGGLWRTRWVGRTSPARHASARLRRNPSRSASRSGIGWTVAPAARAAR